MISFLLLISHLSWARVDDSGLEALRKAAEEEPPGQKAEYQIKNRVTRSALPDGAATELKQDASINRLDSLNLYSDDVENRLGATSESAAASDTATSGLNGLFKRLLQRLTTLISFYASNFGDASNSIRVAAIPGNVSGIADFGPAASTAQTIRTAANVYGVVRATMPSPFENGAIRQVTLDEQGFVGTTDHSVLMTAWGRMFYGTSNYLSTGSTSEANLILLRNPAGSGIMCGLHHIGYGSPNSGEVTYRLYQGPTVTGNGTTITLAGGRTSGNAANTCILSSLPTTSSRGTVFRTARTSNTSTDFADQFHFEYIVDPGTSLLISVTQSLLGQGGNISIHWGEMAQ